MRESEMMGDFDAKSPFLPETAANHGAKGHAFCEGLQNNGPKARAFLRFGA